MNRVLSGMLLVFLSAVAQSISSADLSVRVDRLEQRLSSKVFLEMMEKIDRLQSELQQVRGDMERLSHTVEGMKKSQKDLYLDLDRRLLDLESGVAGSDNSSNPADTTLFLGNTESAPSADKDAVNLTNESAQRNTDAAAPPASAESPRTHSVVDATEIDRSETTSADSQESVVYEEAFAMLNNGRYDDAIRGFNKVLMEYPSGQYADNSQYWLGETYYVLRDFDAARSHFNQVIENYSTSQKIPDAMLKLGFIDYELGQWKASRKVLKTVANDYPGSSAAQLAERRLKRMRKEGH